MMHCHMVELAMNDQLDSANFEREVPMIMSPPII
jgi:hypothetical protein